MKDLMKKGIIKLVDESEILKLILELLNANDKKYIFKQSSKHY